MWIGWNEVGNVKEREKSVGNLVGFYSYQVAGRQVEKFEESPKIEGTLVATSNQEVWMGLLLLSSCASIVKLVA